MDRLERMQTILEILSQDYSTADIARMLGSAESTISKWRRGENVPSRKAIAAAERVAVNLAGAGNGIRFEYLPSRARIRAVACRRLIATLDDAQQQLDSEVLEGIGYIGDVFTARRTVFAHLGELLAPLVPFDGVDVEGPGDVAGDTIAVYREDPEDQLPLFPDDVGPIPVFNAAFVTGEVKP